jgi:hypothetical protein
LTQIERREARLRRIRARLQEAKGPVEEKVVAAPEAHHAIGTSHNYPEDIPLFLQKYAGDPAIKVNKLKFPSHICHLLFSGQDFVPKLKDYILPRIRNILIKEAASNPDVYPPETVASLTGNPESNSSDRNSVLIKSDRMYRHHLARFNYTTYDVRRGQDVINPGTSHRDILLLAGDTDDADSDHPFLYARVLGIYHVNVIYTGEGMLDYSTRRVEFLWVRWFEYVGSRSVRWDDLKLDSVRFPPMANEGSFGFVDPNDVLRACHIAPLFKKGTARLDGIGLSRLSNDARDWSHYYVNRCVQYYVLNSRWRLT